MVCAVCKEELCVQYIMRGLPNKKGIFPVCAACNRKLEED